MFLTDREKEEAKKRAQKIVSEFAEEGLTYEEAWATKIILEAELEKIVNVTRRVPLKDLNPRVLEHIKKQTKE